MADGGRSQAVAALLRWHIDIGVDEAIAEQPWDRFETGPAPSTPPESVVAAASGSVADTTPPDPADSSDGGSAGIGAAAAARRRNQPPPPPGSEEAYQAARRINTLDELKALIAGFDGCPLKETATNLVFGDGSPTARIVLIGEAPGAEEDRQGKPFVGPSGRLLDRMLASIGLDRGRVFISNTVFWRPPGNRAPTSWEIAVCAPFVHRIIELIEPQMLIALGGPAANAMLGSQESVGRLRGRWFEFRSANMAKPVPATALFHPAYLLRSPSQKRLAWRDVLAIKKRLQESEESTGD
ncbi:MAG: uracil-DNA glycosylase [Rhodospirillales bacterium]|nr:uracil-DNA glycosylase [Rhodospirillales bacterium]